MAIESADTISTTLRYFVPPEDGSKPWASVTYINPTTGERNRNYDFKDYTVKIENVRGREDTVSLDTTGFQFIHAPTKHKSFTDTAEIEKEYYPESIEIIKKATGASRVVIFDHTIRRHTPGDKGDHPGRRQPALAVHVDQSGRAAVARVHLHVPEEATSLLQKRFQIINLWRPINHPAVDHPLALCDYRSIDPENDLVPSTLKYPDRDGETLAVNYNPAHRWKYLRGMTPDEAVLIKCSDSVTDGSVAVLTPHTSFADPTTPPDALPRQSIELRTLVFYD